MTDDRRLPDSARYRLDGRIATGGMGEVWRATDGVLGREVAVKLLKREYADDPTFRSRFETEARNAAALHHPNVASVFDFGELPATEPNGAPQPYLVMELVRGEPLSALLRNGEPMLAEAAVDLVAQAAAGITAAHALGIVHRDVKPANLLVTPDGTLKITDFGIARAADAVALTQTGQVIGTPQYLSPEQAEGKPATQASDIYSLGVVLYECLAGRRPFDGDSPIATALSHLRDEPPPLPDEVPEHLRATVAVALAKDPAARFASAAAFAAALRGGPLHTGQADSGASSAARADATTLVAGAAAAPLAAPLAAPAADPPTRTTDPADPGPPRRGKPWLPWVAAALAVLVVVLVVARLAAERSRGTSSDRPSTPTATSTVTERATPTKTASTSPTKTASPSPTKTASTAPTTSATPDETVTVDPADYVGRPVKDATKQLEDLGLTVETVTVENPGDQEKDTVADVSPSGEVDPDQTITLSVYGDPETKKPPKSSKSPDDGTENDNGNGTGNGNGNGNGDGGGPEA